MVQDFTKAGIQTARPPEPADPLTEVVRTGLPSVSGWAGLKRGFDKLTGELPPGIDAPNKDLRKTIAAGSALLVLCRNAMGALFFGLLGLGLVYLGVLGQGAPALLGLGLVSLALAALLGRWAWQAAKDLRSIARA